MTVRKVLSKGCTNSAKNSDKSSPLVVQLLGSGTILREVIAAADLLREEFDVTADIWSVTSFNELNRDGVATARWNMLHTDEPPRTSYVENCLAETRGPVIAATDYMKNYGDQIREFVGRHYTVLGTDGFGRSDTRGETSLLL